MPRLYRLRALFLTLALAMAFVVNPGAAQATTIEVELGDFYIDMPTTIPAGSISFVATNVGEMPHSITIEGEGINTTLDPVLSGGQSGTLVVDLEPGTYVIYCPIPGHRESGMELTLTVTAAAQPTPTVAAPTPTVAAPTPTVAASTPTAGAGTTATPATSPTSTVLPGVPGTGAGGSQPMDSSIYGILMVLVALAGLSVAGTFAYRRQR